MLNMSYKEKLCNSYKKVRGYGKKNKSKPAK